ncbi:MAG: YggS family pyridoxal phosphate-dependent enzyme [Thermoanaerobaculia bacterium]|nr:MAG: YggS family pyridoxal phosphate-dependent enzyme [Thermoanaerobaculia bacterium]
MTGVAERLSEVRARISAAAARAGRDPDSVRLVGASKLQPVAALAEAVAAGLSRFGENRVQEAQTKAPLLPPEVEWHLLGPLQSNKVRPALRLFTVFHAVDRPKIAAALDAEARAQGRAVTALLEVNLGGEASKHGFDPAGLAAAAAPLSALAGLRVVGLMTVPPPGPDAEAARPWFRRLAALRDELNARPEWSGRLTELSMGMSEDFEVAVEEGATFVRVGTLLFGARPPTLRHE